MGGRGGASRQLLLDPSVPLRCFRGRRRGWVAAPESGESHESSQTEEGSHGLFRVSRPLPLLSGRLGESEDRPAAPLRSHTGGAGNENAFVGGRVLPSQPPWPVG